MKSLTQPALQQLGMDIEEQLVATDRRGMGWLRRHSGCGYLLPAANTLLAHRQRVAIISGFPVADGFETDGPAGALALARALRSLGSEVCLLGAGAYIESLHRARQRLQIDCALEGIAPDAAAAGFARFAANFRPTLLVFVEVPGCSADGRYYNMRFEDISERTLPWEQLLELVACPSIAIADGGNELGMGQVGAALAELNVTAAVSRTDHLVLADVSNWGVYGMLALASAQLGRDLLEEFPAAETLQALCAAGLLDGVTALPEASEDGLPPAVGEALIRRLRGLCAAEFHAAQGAAS